MYTGIGHKSVSLGMTKYPEMGVERSSDPLHVFEAYMSLDRVKLQFRHFKFVKQIDRGE